MKIFKRRVKEVRIVQENNKLDHHHFKSINTVFHLCHLKREYIVILLSLFSHLKCPDNYWMILKKKRSFVIIRLLELLMKMMPLIEVEIII